MTRHSSTTSVESTAGLASPGSLVASDSAACSGDVSLGSISDESDNAAVTIGSGSCEAGVAPAAAISVTDLLGATASAAATVSAAANVIGGSLSANSVTGLLGATAAAVANETGGSLSANLVTAGGDGAGRSTMDAAPPTEPNAAIHARTKAGMATSWPNAAMAANRGFMITVSHGAGLDGPRI